MVQQQQTQLSVIVKFIMMVTIQESINYHLELEIYLYKIVGQQKLKLILLVCCYLVLQQLQTLEQQEQLYLELQQLGQIQATTSC